MLSLFAMYKYLFTACQIGLEATTKTTLGDVSHLFQMQGASKLFAKYSCLSKTPSLIGIFLY